MKDFQGKDFYDNPEVFNKYTSHRKGKSNPNELIEKPIIRELTSELKGDVLDLGCGYGDLASELIQRGAESYTGIDSSTKMIDHGNSLIKDDRITLIESDLESWDYKQNKYDWVIARLVLHYIKDLENLTKQINQSLKVGGSFLLSVEHPVLTSSMHLPREKGKKTNWTVDQYFQLGERNQNWMGNRVMKYHRSLEEYWRILNQAGFQVTGIREGRPDSEYFQDSEEFERRMRIPLFLIIKAVKLG